MSLLLVLELGFFSVLVSRLRAAAHALFPPEGEEKKGKFEAERHAASRVPACNKCVPIDDGRMLTGDHPALMARFTRHNAHNQTARGATCRTTPVITGTPRQVPTLVDRFCA
jgi:hypothetical protein